MEERVRPVVAGVDGSESSHAAAEFAAGFASHRSLPLSLVYGDVRPLTDTSPIDRPGAREAAPEQGAGPLTEEFAALMAARWPTLPVRWQRVDGAAATVLIDESRHAELVVVGSRGRGGFKGLLLGSVSTKVAAYAECPVVVIRPPGRPPDVPPSAPVVAGVDGSAESALALELASDEAARLERPLAVIHVWFVNTLAAAPEIYGAAVTGAKAEAEALLADTVRLVQRRHPGLVVREELVHGIDPQRILLDASRSAALVAVGSRGRGGFAGLVLGSVSQALVHHCECPVLISHRPPHREHR